MHGEDLLVDDGSNRQAIEAVREGFPQLDVISSLAFVIEAINPVDRCAFVVATQNEEVFRVLDLVGEKEADCLQRLLASVDIVAEEEVVGFRWEATIFEQAEQVVILAMDVAADLWKKKITKIISASDGKNYKTRHACRA